MRAGILRALGALLAGTSLAVAACGGASSGGQGGKAAPPIKLGMIDTLSGPVAAVGTDGEKGARVAVDEINKAGGVLGRKLQLVTEDEQLSPTASVKAVRDLNSQGVNLLFGFTSSADALAAVPVVKELGMTLVAAHASATELRTTQFVPNFAAVADSDAQSQSAAPEFLHQRFPDVHTWNVFSYDYLTGHQGWNNFTAQMRILDSQFRVGKEVFIPQSATDLTPYITSMLSALPAGSGTTQGVYVFLYGAAEVNLFKQGAPYGLANRFKVILTQGGGYEALANTLKANTPSSWVGYDYSYKAFNTARNRQFVKDFEAANQGTPPDAWAEQSYESVYLYEAAIEKARSDDPAKVMGVFGGLTFEGTQGKVTIQKKDHQALVPQTFTHFEADPGSAQGWKESETVVIWPSKSS
ncbi:MAG TPA: ABC transporter substrate-binding protein [Candidatus Dormibacteraeota bacterium]|nr:ABC transporter substrate-binding protein [Candidatus Dormibacteraeota bacterium]